MDPQFNDALAEIFRGVVIHTSTSYSFNGSPPIDVGTAGTVPNHPLPENPMVRALQSTLYAGCYARSREAVPSADPTVSLSDPAFIARLSQSNRSRNRWDMGWQIYQLGTAGQIFVQKGERARAAMPGEYAITGGPGMAAQVGMSVGLQVLRESAEMQPGFYYVFSETLPDQFDDFSMVRFYFHCTEAAAPPLVEHLTTELNRYQVPFRFKCLTQPAHYTRTDSAVLYIAKRHIDITARIVTLLPESTAAALRPSVPLFSRKMRRGIGLAEDPGNGESFGMHRCRLVAEGIVDAWTKGAQTHEARMEAVAHRFTMNGMSLDRPYLNQGSADLFELHNAGGIEL